MKAARATGGESTRKRVLLVDDHPLMREGIANWINRDPGLQVCCQAASAEEALRSIGRQGPDIVVTDISLGGRNGIDLIQDVRAIHPGLPILVLSMHEESLYAGRALRAGASGYIMKETGGENLVAAINHVLRGGVYVNPRVADKMVDVLAQRRPRGAQSQIRQLSDREFEVFKLIGCGYDTPMIAEELQVSPRTVAVHRANIKRRLGLVGSAALVHQAVHWLEARHRDGTCKSPAKDFA